MPRYVKTKGEIATNFNVSLTTVNNWMLKPNFPPKSKRGWDLKKIKEWRDKDAFCVDSLGRSIPGMSANHDVSDEDAASMEQLRVAKITAEIAKLNQEVAAKKLKNDKTRKSLVERDEVDQWAATSFLRIRQRLESIPRELQIGVPQAVRDVVFSESSNIIHNILKEMSLWAFEPEEDG